MHHSRIVVAIASGLAALVTGSVASAAPAVVLETVRLTPSDGAPEGGFGRDVAIHGDVAVVSANAMSPFPGGGQELPGAAYVYERNSAGVWQETAKLTPQPAIIGDLFGLSVDVEDNVIVIGAPFSRLAHVFEKSAAGWTQTAVLGGNDAAATGSGFAVAIDNGVIAISDDRPHGMALYQRGTSGWTRIAGYTNGRGLEDVDYLGPAVDISGRFAIHGSWGSDLLQPPIPSTAFIYDAGESLDWSNPVVTALTRPGGGDMPDGFSSNVALSGNTALISGVLFERNAAGSWVHTGEIAGGGQALDDQTVISSLSPLQFSTIHRRDSSGGWTHAGNLTTSDGARLARNSIHQNRVLAAPSYRIDSEAAYIFELPGELEPPALLQDDFEDGDAVGWATLPGSQFVVTPENASLVYRQTDTTGNAAALLQTASGDDQAIQVDVTPWSFNGPDRWFGLVVRYSDANNYYYVTARSSGSLQLKKMLGGSYTTLASTTLPVAIGHRNRLRLEAIGDHIRVFVDNEPVLHARDNDLTGGLPGLMMYKTSADFDNVVFNTYPASVAYAYDFESTLYQMEPVAGTWQRVPLNGSLTGYQSDVTGGARAVISSSAKIPGDQIVQADMHPTQFSGPDRWFGLVTRYVDDNNYHYITVRSTNVVLLRKLVNGTPHTLAEMPVDVQLNRTYRLRLESIGTRLRAYVDDLLVAEATDPDVPTEPTTAGVAMYKTAAHVDNFSLLQP